jgi:hypothetical protein
MLGHVAGYSYREVLVQKQMTFPRTQNTSCIKSSLTNIHLWNSFSCYKCAMVSNQSCIRSLVAWNSLDYVHVLLAYWTMNLLGQFSTYPQSQGSSTFRKHEMNTLKWVDYLVIDRELKYDLFWKRDSPISQINNSSASVYGLYIVGHWFLDQHLIHKIYSTRSST